MPNALSKSIMLNMFRSMGWSLTVLMERQVGSRVCVVRKLAIFLKVMTETIGIFFAS